MLNLNEEFTYYKDKSFVNYCLGAYRYMGDHEDYKDLCAYYSDEWGMKRFTIDYTNEEERRMLSKLIYRRIKSDEHAYKIFRCDFDFNMLDFQKETFEEDWGTMRTLFDAYCRSTHSQGFIFTHFAQKSDENIGTLLTKHIHIVYQEPFDGDSFSEFVHKHI